jgi:hypothetical protein
MKDTLTLPESARLVALEKTIAAGQKTFVQNKFPRAGQ